MSRAYSILSDSEKKKEYDQHGMKGIQVMEAMTPLEENLQQSVRFFFFGIRIMVVFLAFILSKILVDCFQSISITLPIQIPAIILFVIHVLSF